MDSRGKNKIRWIIVLLGLLSVFQDLEAATLLGESSAVRETKDDDDDGFSLFGVFSSDDDDDSPPPQNVTAHTGSVSSDGGYDPYEDLMEELVSDVPTNWVPGRLRSSVEVGLQYWEPKSRSGQYVADYDIDPVTVTMIDTAVRVKSWVFLVDYSTSLSDPDNMKNLLAQVSRIEPGAGAWWALYAETGKIEGLAETEDSVGNPVGYPVDTEWNRIGIELRTYLGIYAGLVWEDLTMPVIHTFNNEEIAFAVFDDQTRARTLSLAAGYDKARYLLNNFEKGGAWAWSLEGSVGLGWLDYSEDEARSLIEDQGYATESVELLLAGSVDVRLGYTYSFVLWDTEMQLYGGGRFRASGWMNTAGDAPEAGTVGLETGFGLIQSGVFGRVSFQW